LAAETCGGCGKEVFNMAFCGACFGKLPKRVRAMLRGARSSPEYAGAVEEGKRILKILRAKPLTNSDEVTSDEQVAGTSDE
jgi:hypothetical protein